MSIRLMLLLRVQVWPLIAIVTKTERRVCRWQIHHRRCNEIAEPHSQFECSVPTGPTLHALENVKERFQHGIDHSICCVNDPLAVVTPGHRLDIQKGGSGRGLAPLLFQRIETKESQCIRPRFDVFQGACLLQIWLVVNCGNSCNASMQPAKNGRL